jgi:hypothetical protein
MNPRNLCIVPESLLNRCSANKTGRSRVISCYSRDIGVDVYYSAITIRMMDRVMCSIMTGKVTPSVLIKLIRSQCVVAVVKRLKVLATCHEIWKAVNLVTNRPKEWTYLPPLVILVFCTCTDVREYVPHSGQEYGNVVALQTYVLHIGCAYGPTVACGGPDPRVGMKGKRLLRKRSLDVPSV